MSRYCGEVNTTPILEAAQRWRDQALLSDGSVFNENALWTTQGLEALNQYFVENPDLSDETFWPKLQLQLAPTAPEVKQLAAEMNWLMFLCPSNLVIASKRKRIQEVWSWSNEAFPQSAANWLSDSVLRGVGSGGPGFNNYRWLELAYLIKICLTFKRLSEPEREELLSDGWKFAEWLGTLEESKTRQLRHMLLFLLFPDDFERIFGNRDRKAVVLAFGKTDSRAANSMSPVQIDRMLDDIRRQLEVEYKKKDLDFYESPLKALWKPESFSTLKQAITREHVLQALAEIDKEGIPADAESTTYDLLHLSKQYPPKLVLSKATKYANGEEFSRSSFSSGEGSPAFNLLRSLGFEIVFKGIVSSLIKQFLDQAKAGEKLSVAGYPKTYRQLDISVSFGQGSLAHIPWIAFLGFDQRVSNGIYPVLLLYKELNVLVLAYGISETKDAATTWDVTGASLTISQYFKDALGRKPERYGTSLVAHVYDVTTGIDIPSLTQSLDAMIDRYKELFADGQGLPPIADTVERIPYTIDEALKDVFISRDSFINIISRLRKKQNVILQGPPGVGKTFVARRLAYALMEEKAKDRVRVVQFHPAYSYEDFVQGYRPSGNGFQLKNGVFHDFCTLAKNDPERPYVFIIDEVNRANLSKVFGELMMLMEHDKRGSDWAIPLAYSQEGSDTFFVPSNIYIIGLMNTADRSLAMVDYALRRRFSFIDIEPGFDTDEFTSYLAEAGATAGLSARVIADMRSLNNEIGQDRASLGPGFCVGHSFFCINQKERDGAVTLNWYHDVIRAEILPLLREYWFDDIGKVESWERRLLEG